MHVEVPAERLDVDSEVDRLVALDASVAERKLGPFGAPLVVLRDPEGNGFCVEPA